MQRLTLILAALLVLAAITQPVTAAPLSHVVRARIIMDLIKDGNVTTPANYAADKVDYASVQVAAKWADLVWQYHHGDQEADNKTKARFYLNELRKWHRSFLKHEKEKTANTTVETETDTELETDLGTEEGAEVEP